MQIYHEHLVDKTKLILAGYDEILSTGDVAIILSVCDETVRRLIKRCELKSTRHNHSIYITKQWLIEFMMSTERDFRTRKDVVENRKDAVVEFCKVPRNWHDLLEFTGYRTKSHLQRYITRPLLSEGRLQMTIPTKAHHNGQCYFSI